MFTLCDRFPSIATINPTPQASFSRMGSYRPCFAGRDHGSPELIFVFCNKRSTFKNHQIINKEIFSKLFDRSRYRGLNRALQGPVFLPHFVSQQVVAHEISLPGDDGSGKKQEKKITTKNTRCNYIWKINDAWDEWSDEAEV